MGRDAVLLLTDSLGRVVANQKSKRRSRKPRAKPGAAPKAVASQRREQRAEREAVARQRTAQATRTLGTVGERPESPFGGLPISEFFIFAGLIAVVVGLITGGTVALVGGAIICGLGVVEVTAREHFSGFRSHTTLLAAIPAVIVEAILAETVGTLRGHSALLLPVIPVFGLCFWLLRRSFQSARHARVTRPPAS
jgi:hypothetical protein